MAKVLYTMHKADDLHTHTLSTYTVTELLTRAAFLKMSCN